MQSKDIPFVSAETHQFRYLKKTDSGQNLIRDIARGFLFHLCLNGTELTAMILSGFKVCNFEHP